MENERKWFLSYYPLAIAGVILALIFFMRLRTSDVDFCRQVLKSLIAGKVQIENAIDWPSFKALENDVGAVYVRLPSENEKRYLRQAFILNFSLSFKNLGGQFRAFRDWRLYRLDKEKTVVSCRALGNRTLLFTISQKYGKRKLTAMEWKE